MLENNNFPKVSVIIPTYNRPNLIKRTIKSVLNQTYQNFEIIVVDDSPNDETEKVVKSFNDKRIKYFKIEECKEGSAAARKKNFGVKHSNPNSQYIAFLDDDDEWLPQFLKVTITELENDTNLFGVIPWGISKLADGTELKKRALKPEDFKVWKHGVGNGWVLKKEIFEKMNIWYDERDIFEDLDFGIKLKDYKLKIIPQKLWVYYVLPSTRGVSSSTKFERQANNIDYFFQKHYSTYAQAGKEALGFLYYFTGKIYCQATKFEKGRKHLKKAFQINPSFEYLLYYLISLLFPEIFLSYRLQIWKHKIFQK